jgi:trimethylamine--corrinoid protein Co-methyltransferase
VQAANETQFGTWGCLLAGATVTIHAAGWLEGGLSVSYEKLITDIDVLQMVAELCANTSADTPEIAMDALADVQPGGHFFGTQHTMDRYQTAFYEPIASDLTNFGTWAERGAIDTNTRATGIWKDILANFKAPPMDGDRVAGLDDYIRKGTAAGGAAPES